MKYFPLVLLLFLSGCNKTDTQFDIIDGEPINLIGSSWELYQSNEIPSVNIGKKNFPIIEFGLDGFGIQSSCNHMFGRMVLTSSSFTFEDLATTYLMCYDERKMIEVYFHKLVDNEISYKFSKGILYLYNGNKVFGSFKRTE